MSRVRLVTTAIVAIGFLGAHPVARRASRGTTPSLIGYDDFMKISVDQRRGRFASLTAANKSLIVRTHGERWLADNRGRLTIGEIAVFQDMVNFVTPERYAKRAEAGIDKEEQALRDRMRCRVSTVDVVQAFNVFGNTSQPPSKPRWTYLNQATCWIEWVAEDFIDSIPTVGR